MSAAGLSGVNERTSFLGSRIPTQIKTLSKFLPSFSKPLYRSLLKLAVDDLEGKEILPETYQLIKKSHDEPEDVDTVYSGIYTLLRYALRIPENSLKPEVFKEDLRELKIPDDFISDLLNIIFGQRRLTIDKNLITTAPHLPRLDKLRWRVDVTISTSSLNRVLEPSVLMETLSSDGRKETFEVQQAQFHQLRFAVATLLKEIENLEKKNVLKV